MSGGFRAHVDSLATLANKDLPRLAEIVVEPIPALAAAHTFGPTGGSATATAVFDAYMSHVEPVTSRQKLIAQAIDETAEALREIEELYRRADGQV